MSGPTSVAALTAIQTLQNSLIRKALNYSVFVADYTEPLLAQADLFSVTTGSLLDISAKNYIDLGYLDDSGAKFSDSIKREDITSLQSASPTRSDITGEDISLTVTPQETNMATIATFLGQSYSGAWLTTKDAGGAMTIDMPQIPADKHVRAFGIAQDTIASGPVYIVRIMPNAILDSKADQQFQKTGELSWGFTLKALFDSAAGTAHRWIFGGEGWKSQLTAAGFTAGV